MGNGFFFGAYWDARESPVEKIAMNLVIFIQGLNDICLAGGQWYEKASSKKHAKSKLIYINQEEILNVLLKGSNKNDEGNILSELGWRIGIWSEGKCRGETLSMSGTVGCNHPKLLNALVLEFHNVDVSVSFPSTSQSLAVFDLFISNFDPDWIVLTDNELLDLLQDAGCVVKPLPGYIMYASRKYAYLGWPKKHATLNSVSAGDICVMSDSRGELSGSNCPAFRSLVDWSRNR